jgi:ABC-type bacteriocin/lantibiotic exporter with double-glycine peptidase domain
VAIVVFVVSLVGVTYVQTGDIEGSYPLVGMFGVAALRLGPAVTMVISSVVILRNQRHGIAMLAIDLTEIREKKTVIMGEGESSNETTFGKLELQNVCFTYESSIRPALENISLEVVAGESIGLIGVSGSGKTTLVDVMLGLLQPQSGKILYNGGGMKESLSGWRSNVAYLPQDVFLIDDSLRCNIALGVPENEINEQAVSDAIEKARLKELIPELAKGVDTMIGERGVRLSGGQRQRVALARALYHGRGVLVLDEATSALDNETEREIVAEIQELKGEKTMIVIAHRLTTLQHCDRIYRLKKGKIIQTGTYDQVIHGPKIES